MTLQDMEAIVLERPGGPLVLRRLDVPRPGQGEVLIRVAASPINPSDLGFVAGTYGSGARLPAVPGFEGSGTVVASGGGLLARLLNGRRVAFASAAAGCWAEYLVVPATSCIPVGTLPLEEAATLVVNPYTALAFFDMARRDGHHAIVSDAAASALGKMIIRLGRSRGLPVINIVRRPEQAAELRDMGAQHVLLDSEEEFPDRLRGIAGRLNATLVLDPIAGERTGLLVDAAPVGSTIVAYALLSGQPSSYNARRLIADRKRIESFYLGHWIARRPLWRKLRDICDLRREAAGLLRTQVERKVPLAAASEAVETYRGRMTAGKILLVADAQALAPHAPPA